MVAGAMPATPPGVYLLLPASPMLSERQERALKLLEQMEARGVRPTVISYSAAISACEKGQQWERALELLAQIGDGPAKRLQLRLVRRLSLMRDH